MYNPKPLMMDCAGPKAGGSIHLAWLLLAGRGFAFLQRGKSLHQHLLAQGGGLFVCRGSGQIGSSLSWPSCPIASRLLHLRLASRRSFVASCSFPWQPSAARTGGRTDGRTDGPTMGMGAAAWEQGGVREQDGACRQDQLHVIA